MEVKQEPDYIFIEELEIEEYFAIQNEFYSIKQEKDDDNIGIELQQTNLNAESKIGADVKCNLPQIDDHKQLKKATPIDFNGTEGNSLPLLEEDMSIEFDKTLTSTMSPNLDEIRKKFGSFATDKIPLTAYCFNDFVELVVNIMEKQDKTLRTLGKILGGIQYELRGLREQFSSSNVAIAKFNISQEDVEIASMFPIQSKEKLQDVEVKLQHNEFFHKVLASVSLVEGKDINKLISNILRQTLSKELSLEFSGLGRKGKKNFSNLQLYKVILAAVKIRYNDVDDTVVLKRTSSVLATSGDRDGGRKARSTK